MKDEQNKQYIALIWTTLYTILHNICSWFCFQEEPLTPSGGELLLHACGQKPGTLDYAKLFTWSLQLCRSLSRGAGELNAHWGCYEFSAHILKLQALRAVCWTILKRAVKLQFTIHRRTLQPCNHSLMKERPCKKLISAQRPWDMKAQYALLQYLETR